MTRTIIDIETTGISDAADYLDEITVPSNYTKDESKAVYIEKTKADQLGKAGLDPDLCWIAAIGIQAEGHEPQIVSADQLSERSMLDWLWVELTNEWGGQAELITYNGLNFDIPVLLRRSLYLGVAAPFLPTNRYRHDGVQDLLQILSFDGKLRYRSLRWYCRRLGLPLPEDEIDGGGIAEAVNQGEWAKVRRHLLCDLQMTASLAARLGFFDLPTQAESDIAVAPIPEWSLSR